MLKITRGLAVRQRSNSSNSAGLRAKWSAWYRPDACKQIPLPLELEPPPRPAEDQPTVRR